MAVLFAKETRASSLRHDRVVRVLRVGLGESSGNRRCPVDQKPPAIRVEEAFRMALEIETSEIEAIYGRLLQLGGPKIAQTMENLGVPAKVQRQKLKLAMRRFCSNPELLEAAERL